jgi:hypothetical protein
MDVSFKHRLVVITANCIPELELCSLVALLVLQELLISCTLISKASVLEAEYGLYLAK